MRGLYLVLAAMAMLFTLPGCVTTPPDVVQPTQTRFEFATVAMGGRVNVILYGEHEPEAAEAARAAFAEIECLEQVMSDYRPSSEIRVFLRSATLGEWAPVSPTLMDAMVRSQAVSDRTGRAFAITVGPAVTLWREARQSGELPARAAIERARLAGDPALLELDPDRGTARLLRPGMQIDFGGIGKGLAADAARRVLAERGFPSCLVDMGGDLALGAPPPGEEGWSVRVETGVGESETRLLSETCVATSGDAEQSVEIGGVRYSHIIDPRTGMALTDRRAATVIHPDGATADALASAACVLGPDRVSVLERTYPDATVSVIEGGPG